MSVLFQCSSCNGNRCRCTKSSPRALLVSSRWNTKLRWWKLYLLYIHLSTLHFSCRSCFNYYICRCCSTLSYLFLYLCSYPLVILHYHPFAHFFSCNIFVAMHQKKQNKKTNKKQNKQTNKQTYIFLCVNALKNASNLHVSISHVSMQTFSFKAVLSL